MNYRLLAILAVVLCLAALCVWLLFGTHPTESEPHLIQTPTTTTNATNSKLASQNPNPLPPGVTLPKGVFHSNVELETAVLQMLHATPIKFYGKVVDQDNNPIADADVTGQPSQNIMQNGATNNPLLPSKSDSDGLFSFSTHGASIAIQIHKNGYYETKSQTYFGYDPSYKPNYQPHPNPNDPAIFVMRKVGKIANLVRIKHDIDFPVDGSTIEVTIRGIRAKPGQGDLIVQGWVQYGGRAPHLLDPFDWKAIMSTTGGGGIIIDSNGPYDFTAPEDGYSEQIVVEMPASLGKDWKRGLTNSYFVRTKDNLFARIDLSFVAHLNPYIQIDGYLNPTPGDRNLEFDPQNPPKEP